MSLDEIKEGELYLLIYLFKWLMGVFAACIPIVLLSYYRIKKDVAEIKTEIGLLNLKYTILEKTVIKNELDFKQLEKTFYLARNEKRY